MFERVELLMIKQIMKEEASRIRNSNMRGKKNPKRLDIIAKIMVKINGYNNKLGRNV